MTTPYQQQDIINTLYNAVSVPLTADGNSSTSQDWSVAGGVPPSEIILDVDDIETGESIVFTLYDFISGSYVATPYKLSITQDGVYVWPIDNRVITGNKFRIAHDITLSTTTKDGIKVHGHTRPRTL